MHDLIVVSIYSCKKFYCNSQDLVIAKFPTKLLVTHGMKHIIAYCINGSPIESLVIMWSLMLRLKQQIF